MEEKDLKKSFVLKTVCYICLPIIIALLIASTCSLIYSIVVTEVSQDKQYIDTQRFAKLYSNKMSYAINMFEKINVINNDEILYEELLDYYDTGFYYLIISSTGETITNVEKTGRTDTTSKIIEYLQSGDKYLSINKGEVQTNIEYLRKEDIIYSRGLSKLFSNDYTIYTMYDSSQAKEGNIKGDSIIYNLSLETYKMSYWLVPILTVLVIIMSIYIIVSAGHKKGYKEIYLDLVDKIPLEIIAFAEIMGLVFCSTVAFNIAIDEIGDFIVCVIVGIIAYILLLIGGLTVVKRIKARTLFKNTIIWMICKEIRYLIKTFFENRKIAVRLGIYYAIVLFGLLILGSITIKERSFFAFILLVAFIAFVFYIIIKRIQDFREIQEAIQNVYEGKTNIRLDTEKYKGELKSIATQLNDIAGGFSNAIQENLKSERLKTELITNVSHDIKTPLTSIINYVDLLKQEKIEGEKAKEYLEILDNKSQKLKKLIEDLVEASKASSGNIKLNIEKLNVKELIKQQAGEFEDKLKAKDLQIISEIPEEDLYINADGRYLSRVLDNIYSNISKYALQGSRIYVDILERNGRVIMAFKNISKDKLNISEEELMQRFVRGDASRNTEGSGLGLSIARSLTELQDGEFNINIDGDLFKVVLVFKKVQRNI